jgi:hypothetical protein
MEDGTVHAQAPKGLLVMTALDQERDFVAQESSPLQPAVQLVKQDGPLLAVDPRKVSRIRMLVAHRCIPDKKSDE